MDIPDELRLFLADPGNRRLELGPGGEVEQLELFALDELSETTFTVVGRSREDMDEVRGIKLTKWCPNYSPEGVMV